MIIFIYPVPFFKIIIELDELHLQDVCSKNKQQL